MSVGPPPSYQSVVGGGGGGYPGPPVHTSPSAPSMPPSTVTGMRPYANPYQPAVPPAAYNVQNPTNKDGYPPTAPLTAGYATGPGYATTYPSTPASRAYDNQAFGAYNPTGRTEGAAASNVVNINAQETPGGVNQWNTASFSDKKIRMAFIRKVYLILMTQLAFTFTIVCVFSFVQPIKVWMRSGANQAVYWASYAVFLVTYIILVCIPKVRRQVPYNYITLAIFTLALTYMTATLSSFHSTYIVLVAIGITAAVCLAISLFAIQTKIDFTMCGGLLFALCMVLMLFGISVLICYLITGNSFQTYVMQCVYGGIAALVFSLFLAYDTQMLIGGRKYQLSEEEYVYGALQLYMDIVYLFIIILSLFGAGNK